MKHASLDVLISGDGLEMNVNMQNGDEFLGMRIWKMINSGKSFRLKVTDVEELEV